MSNGYLTYQEKLKDSRWKERSKQIRDKYENTCCACGGREIELHVHHNWYEKGKQPWDYPDECFLLLCCDCHNDWHKNKLELDRIMTASFTDIGVLKGFVRAMNPFDKDVIKTKCEAIGYIMYKHSLNIGIFALPIKTLKNILKKEDIKLEVED